MYSLLYLLVTVVPWGCLLPLHRHGREIALAAAAAALVFGSFYPHINGPDDCCLHETPSCIKGIGLAHFMYGLSSYT